MTDALSALRDDAVSVLRANDRGSYTVPAPHLYPHQWAWDSAFVAIGWVHVDPGRAVLELETLLRGAWSDGRVPHVQFHEPGEYFPGPELWRAPTSSTITQPPVWAIAARRIAEVTGDPGIVAHLVRPIAASHEFLAAARDPLGWGVVAVAHPWESGMDNGPQWDAALAGVDPSAAPSFVRVDLEKVDDPGQRPDDSQYRRYTALVVRIAEDGFGPGPFAVYDPFITSILARAEVDLAAVARATGHPSEADQALGRSRRLLAGLIDRLWDADSGRFAHHDARAGRSSDPDVIGSYGPLMLADRLPADVAARLRDGLDTRFRTDWPLPTTAPTDPAFEDRRYWRGPTWINVNWLLAPFVGWDVVDSSLRLLAREGFREYFEPFTGQGLGARSFSWSAALALDWIAERS